MSRESAHHVVTEMIGFPTGDGLAALWMNYAYDALGYATWQELVDSELRPALDRLSKHDRHELAVNMREHGCSLRSIATVTGWSHTTVQARVEPDGKRAHRPRTYRAEVLDTAWKLRSAAERLGVLVTDDRFAKVRDNEDLASHIEAASLMARVVKGHIQEGTHA